ncbi:MAG: exo-alpha-sialidase [Frankiaceae bacterium]|nr:exo-alpha-sialidase [Frankiaceae bacterium]
MRRRALVLLATLTALAAPAAASATGQAAATYTAYNVGISGGEPTLGFDTARNAAVYGSGTSSKRLTWDDAEPAQMTIVDVKPKTSVTTLDPITFTDRVTNRTFVSQLYLACSLTSFSDDAGATWTPSQGCGPDTMVDHQTIGGGPYAGALAGQNPVYPNAVYYCAQNGFSGTCARSDDGGLTFGPGTPAYNTPANAVGDPYGGACSAIHGHLKVALDGTVYLPNKGCGGTPTVQNLTNSEFFGGSPAVSVSEDNGITWTVRKVPGARNQDESDPSVDTDQAGAVYLGWQDGVNPSETVYGTTSSARIAVSTDKGRTWSTPYDVSTALGINNVQFPEVVAGVAGRAAFAFLGTPGIGDDQHNGFVGAWHLYVATTLDGGASWSTVDTTPDDPVQRGCISLQGTSNKTVLSAVCGQRNLLDFNDITIDREGRVLVAYADGCTSAACIANPGSGSSGARSMVMRQSSGPLLVGDLPTPVVPEIPAAALLPLTAVLMLLGVAAVRRRRQHA